MIDLMVRPERFELPTSWFVARRSIQLSYGRKGQIVNNYISTIDQDKRAIEWPKRQLTARCVPRSLRRLALKPSLAASGARILPHQLQITIPSPGRANFRVVRPNMSPE